MILAGLLTLTLALHAQDVSDAPAPGTIVRTVHGPPAAVEVGEPFPVVLELVHPADTGGVALSAGELTLDDSWVLLDTRLEPAVVEGDAASGRRVTRRVFEVVSLEPGERTLTLAGLSPLAEGDAEEEQVTVSVTGVLAADEDAPRPLRGFPPAFGEGRKVSTSLPPWAWALGGAMVLSAGVLGWFLRRRPGPATKADAPVDPLARLALLEAEETKDLAGLRARHFALSRLLREATDAKIRGDRTGCTDEEWLALVATSLSPTNGGGASLEAALAGCARVKYAGELPSPFAVQETFDHARRALEALAALPNGREVAS